MLDEFLTVARDYWANDLVIGRYLPTTLSRLQQRVGGDFNIISRDRGHTRDRERE